MSTAMWKLEKDLCRCCHAEGSFKHLSDPCFQLGQEEIYSDMLQDCLDIKIIPMTGVLSDVTYTICETCVARLRDASNFKRQVQDCEERFKDMYSKNLIRGFEVKEEPSFNESDDMKQEFQSIDEDDDDAFLNFDDDADDSLDDRQQITVEVESKAKGKGKAKPKPKSKKPTPVKKTKAKEKSIKMETEELTVAAVSGEKKKDVNSEESRKKVKAKAKESDCVQSSISSSSLLRDRLTKKAISASPGSFSHKAPKYEDFVKPIGSEKTSYACRLCDFQSEERFRVLHHVPSQHIQEISCSTCGEVFSDPEKLEAHKSQPHSNLKYPCPTCELVLPTKTKLRMHQQRHYPVKCRHCPEKMLKFEIRQHLLDFHGDLMPTCGVCGLKTTLQSTIEKHQRMVHLKEKNVSCEICNFQCFSAVQLKKHMISHKVEKLYECRYCKKKFPRQTTCRIHEMIHTGEKTKVCSVCNAAFVQKASLNYHMMKHHPDQV